MKSVKASWVMMLCAMFAVAVPAYAQQPTEEPIIKLLNDIADKPENHLAIAAYYRTLAGDALAESEKHKAMRNTYRHNHQARCRHGSIAGQALRQADQAAGGNRRGIRRACEAPRSRSVSQVTANTSRQIPRPIPIDGAGVCAPRTSRSADPRFLSSRPNRRRCCVPQLETECQGYGIGLVAPARAPATRAATPAVGASQYWQSSDIRMTEM